MTEISVAREAVAEELAGLLDVVDEVDRAIGDRPAAADGGIASALIGLIASAGADAAGTSADTPRALVAVALDVLDDFALTDEQVAEQLRDFTEEVEP